MCVKKAGVKKREKIPSGEGGTGTFGPAIPVNGEISINPSCDDHRTFSLRTPNTPNDYKFQVSYRKQYAYLVTIGSSIPLSLYMYKKELTSW